MPGEPPNIDDLDRKIVERLRVDGRETNRSLAGTSTRPRSRRGCAGSKPPA
jgi:DNA-binding Lrp family transcriptional regulator